MIQKMPFAMMFRFLFPKRAALVRIVTSCPKCGQEFEVVDPHRPLVRCPNSKCRKRFRLEKVVLEPA